MLHVGQCLSRLVAVRGVSRRFNSWTLLGSGESPGGWCVGGVGVALLAWLPGLGDMALLLWLFGFDAGRFAYGEGGGLWVVVGVGRAVQANGSELTAALPAARTFASAPLFCSLRAAAVEFVLRCMYLSLHLTQMVRLYSFPSWLFLVTGWGRPRLTE